MVQKRVGAYAKLLANYASDDAIIAAGEKAELLFVRGLAFLATADSDGYITEAQLVRFVGAGMSDAKKRAQALVREGLWEAVDGGYIVRSWLKIHDSAEEKGRKRRTDRERKQRGKPSDAPNGVQADSERNPDGTAPESLLCTYVSGSVSTEQSIAEQGRATTRSESPTALQAVPPLDDLEIGLEDPGPEPAPYCPKHMPNGPTANCGPCGDARRNRQRWQRDEAAYTKAYRKAYQRLIDGCPDCDEHGRRLDAETKSIIGVCSHRRTA